MKFISKFNCLYIFVISLSFLLFNINKVKPKLKEVLQKENNSYFYYKNKIKDIKKKHHLDNRVEVGDGVYIDDKSHWYKVIPVSFWRKSYLDLTLVENNLEIIHEKIIKLDKNNFAFGILNDKKVAYACMENASNFHHNFYKINVPNNSDLKYWKNVFLVNIGHVLYSFKPNNYNCLVVITSNIKFFEQLKKGKNEFLINKIMF